jgi:hypothetical protein
MTIASARMTEPSFPQSALETFRALYPDRSGTLTHTLVDHPLLTLEALAGLAARHDPAHVEYNRADLPIGIDPHAVPGNGLTIDETIRSIEHNGSWMVIKWVENDAAYKGLLEDALAPLRPLVEPMTGKMLTLQGFVFVSSPNAVTPFHMDPEHNILLQVRGTKDFCVFPAVDDELLNDVEHERYHVGGHRNLPWRDSFAAKGTTHRLTPGDAIHVPVKAPHWIKNGPDLSISFSITWRSLWSYREADARGFNHVLRGLGLSPRAPGRFPQQNIAKSLAYRAIRRVRGIA